MARSNLFSALSVALCLAAPASAAVIRFDENPPANDESTTLGEQYAHLGVHFRTTDDGAVWAGVSRGDPGGWGLEGTSGPAFAGFDGVSYAASLQFDAPVAGFGLDVARAVGSSYRDRFELLGLRAGRLVERVNVLLAGVNEWVPVELSQEVDRVVWYGIGVGAHPYGVDNLRWIGDEPEIVVHEVGVDVKPGSDRNPVNPKSRGVLPVALLGTPGLPAEAVDADGPLLVSEAARALPVGDPHVEDVNDDGVSDLVYHYAVGELELVGPGEAELCLEGTMADGASVFRGCDGIVILGR